VSESAPAGSCARDPGRPPDAAERNRIVRGCGSPRPRRDDGSGSPAGSRPCGHIGRRRLKSSGNAVAIQACVASLDAGELRREDGVMSESLVPASPARTRSPRRPTTALRVGAAGQVEERPPGSSSSSLWLWCCSRSGWSERHDQFAGSICTESGSAPRNPCELATLVDIQARKRPLAAQIPVTPVCELGISQIRLIVRAHLPTLGPCTGRRVPTTGGTCTDCTPTSPHDNGHDCKDRNRARWSGSSVAGAHPCQ